MVNIERTEARKKTGSPPLRIAIQGVSGAFHEIAARLCLKKEEVEIVPANTFEELVDMIENDPAVDGGLMAIENTIAGSLMKNYTLLQNSDLLIMGETYLRIKQNLMVIPGTKIEDLKAVHSHPIAIEQCLEFFKDYPGIKLVDTLDTALSAKQVMEEQWKDTGAIASTLAADLYGMEVVAEGIETNKKNHTRFLVLQPKGRAKKHPKSNKVSISFCLSHEVGNLHGVLAVLAAYQLNLTKIQSAPIIGKPWEYQFFVDFIMGGSIGFEKGIDALRPITHKLRVLGIYPQGEHFEY